MDAKFGFKIFFNHILTATCSEFFLQYIMFVHGKRGTNTMVNCKKVPMNRLAPLLPPPQNVGTGCS